MESLERPVLVRLPAGRFIAENYGIGAPLVRPNEYGNARYERRRTMRCLRSVYRQYTRILVATLLACLALLGATGQAQARPSAYPTDWLLGVPSIRQDGNWCTAASCVSILGYYGTNISQCTFVSWVRGDCDTSVAVSMEDGQSGLAHWHICSTAKYDGPLSFGMVISETYANRRPIFAVQTWPAIGQAHAMVIDGYTTEGQYGETLYYMNPAWGTHEWSAYSVFKGGAGYTWDRTLYQMRGC